MHRISFFIFFILCASLLNAQQQPENNFYVQNPYLINPSFAGYKLGIQSFTWANSSFQGIDGSPKSMLVGVQGAVKKSNFGVGGKFALDQRGIYESFSFDFTTSYKLLLDNFQLISFGIDAGFINNAFNQEGLTSQVDLNDPTLNSEYFNRTSLKVGFGISYLSQKIQVGAAFPRFAEGGEALNSIFNVFGAYILKKQGNPLTFKPSFIVQGFNDDTFQYGVDFMTTWQNVIWGQLGYRSNNTIGLSTGVKWNLFSAGYHFALPIGNEVGFYVNHHELLLSLSFARKDELAFIREKRKRKKVKRKG